MEFYIDYDIIIKSDKLIPTDVIITVLLIILLTNIQSYFWKIVQQHQLK